MVIQGIPIVVLNRNYEVPRLVVHVRLKQPAINRTLEPVPHIVALAKGVDEVNRLHCAHLDEGGG